MKTERRHELQTNELADRLAHLIVRIQPVARPLGLALLGAILVGAVYWAVSASAGGRRREGWDQFLAAVNSGREEQYSEIMVAHAGTPVATMAQLRLADAQLRRGIELLFTNRPAALDELKSAEENFQAVRDAATKDTRLRQRAWFCLARTRESLNKLDEARADYEGLTRDFPNGIYSPMAKGRLGELAAAGTQQFYAWFAEQNPRPAADTSLGSGTDGKKFEFESLPDDSSGILPTTGLGGLSDAEAPGAEPTGGDSAAPGAAAPDIAAPGATAPDSAAPAEDATP